MLGITDLKKGTLIEYEGAPYRVLTSEHSKMGRGGAVMRTRLRNLLTGSVIDVTFRGGDSITQASVAKRPAQFLYADGTDLVFMDSANYEQVRVAQEFAGGAGKYLREGDSAILEEFKGKLVGVDLPIKVELKVAAVGAGAKGDTANNPTKDATLETGHVLKVPLFINTGDTLRVDTRTGTYVERV